MSRAAVCGLVLVVISHEPSRESTPGPCIHTLPNTTCFESSQGSGSNVMKNWLLLLSRPTKARTQRTERAGGTAWGTTRRGRDKTKQEEQKRGRQDGHKPWVKERLKGTTKGGGKRAKKGRGGEGVREPAMGIGRDRSPPWKHYWLRRQNKWTACGMETTFPARAPHNLRHFQNSAQTASYLSSPWKATQAGRA